jgi:hypothetical protein
MLLSNNNNNNSFYDTNFEADEDIQHTTFNRIGEPKRFSIIDKGKLWAKQLMRISNNTHGKLTNNNSFSSNEKHKSFESCDSGIDNSHNDSSNYDPVYSSSSSSSSSSNSSSKASSISLLDESGYLVPVCAPILQQKNLKGITPLNCGNNLTRSFSNRSGYNSSSHFKFKQLNFLNNHRATICEQIISDEDDEIDDDVVDSSVLKSAQVCVKCNSKMKKRVVSSDGVGFFHVLTFFSVK